MASPVEPGPLIGIPRPPGPPRPPFTVLPAIDLRGGRVVRLEAGDFARETIYSDDPTSVALAFVAAGGRWLHVVDLDGARVGRPAHRSAIEDIVEAVTRVPAADLEPLVPGAAVEVAGGLRDRPAVDAMLAAGAARVVLGTAALRHPASCGVLVEAYGPERIAVAIDVRGGVAVGDGWVDQAGGVDALTAIATLADLGVTTFEVTAIERDGGRLGPDLALYERCVALGRGDIIASAGIATPGHLSAVRDAGCAGAIIGRALYDGTLSLAAALAAIEDPDVA